MALIFIYNAAANTIERFTRGLNESMPYVWGRTLTVGEFRANSSSSILWTTRQMIDAWNVFRTGWGRSIFVGYAFKRIWEGGHAAQSQHYAGVALDMGHTLTQAGREELYNYAKSTGVWSYVEPLSLSPRWLHVDKRYGISACPEGGFPELSVGSKGVYVLVLQDSLMALGFSGSGLDGIFGLGTRGSLLSFQRARGIAESGIADCATWTRLTSEANGIGATSTVEV